MTLSETVRMFGDFAEIALSVLMIYVAYRIAHLIDTLDRKIREKLPP